MSEYVLAFDFGTKRIGVASLNTRTLNITPAYQELSPIPARDGIPNWDVLSQLIKERAPERLLVGLPLDAEGEDMEITRRARKFGNRLRERYKTPVEFIDERLTTKAAKSEAYNRGHKGNYANSPVDSIAARLILETWVNTQ